MSHPALDQEPGLLVELSAVETYQRAARLREVALTLALPELIAVISAEVPDFLSCHLEFNQAYLREPEHLGRKTPLLDEQTSNITLILDRYGNHAGRSRIERVEELTGQLRTLWLLDLQAEQPHARMSGASLEREPDGRYRVQFQPEYQGA